MRCKTDTYYTRGYEENAYYIAPETTLWTLRRGIPMEVFIREIRIGHSQNTAGGCTYRYEVEYTTLISTIQSRVKLYTVLS